MKFKKNTLRIIAAVLFVMCLATLLCACSEKKEIKDDVKATDLSKTAKEAIPIKDGYASITDADYLEFNFEGLPTAKEYDIFITTNPTANINEVGIFHFANADEAAKAESIVAQYIKTKSDAWKSAANYTPEENPKMESATYKVIGNYVVYTILTEKDSASVMSAVENALTK